MNSPPPEAAGKPCSEDLPQTRRLLDIMSKLRSRDGCPWDREQTLESLKPYLIEECGEVLEAIERGEPRWLADELGDLLLQVVFQAQICSEEGHFDFEEVARRISEKLIRRHPHVFAGELAEGPEDVRKSWDEIKKEEPGPVDSLGSILPDVPRHLPALMRAAALQKAAARVGFDWEEPEHILEKIAEETDELRDEMRQNASHERLKDEVGDLLFAVVNLARRLDVGAEEALNGTVRKFRTRFRHVEEALAERGRTPEEATLAEMDALWDEAKEYEYGDRSQYRHR